MQDTRPRAAPGSRPADGGFVVIGALILALGSAIALAITSGCHAAPRADGNAFASTAADKAAETRLRQAAVDMPLRPFDEQFHVASPQDADE